MRPGKGEYAAVLGYMVVNNREQFEDDVGREGELKLSLLGERFVTIQHYWIMPSSVNVDKWS